MQVRIARLASLATIAAALAIPGSAVAADSSPAAPPPTVIEWQAHLDHTRSMSGNLEVHVGDCTEMHGSMAGQFGPNGSMVEMLDGGMMR
jgi:hypothetical protein